MEDVQAIVLDKVCTTNDDRWNYCIMADWILVGVIMGWHSIKRTVEGVVLVKLLSSLPLYLCQTLDCSFCNVP